MIRHDHVAEYLNRRASAFAARAAFVEAGFRLNAEELGLNVVLNRVGSMMTAFFTEAKQVTSFDEAMTSDTGKYAEYFKNAVENGLYIAPSQFECLFISMAHTEEDLEKLIKGNRKALEAIK